MTLFSSKMQKLVVKAVSLAIARDGASGGVVRTVVVSILTVYILQRAQSLVKDFAFLQQISIFKKKKKEMTIMLFCQRHIPMLHNYKYAYSRCILI